MIDQQEVKTLTANEFVKMFGWVRAEGLLHRLVRLGVCDAMKSTLINNMWTGSSFGFTYAELERLIKSHYLVYEHESLDRAIKYANSPYTAPEIAERLKQAIADVESCQ